MADIGDLIWKQNHQALFRIKYRQRVAADAHRKTQKRMWSWHLTYDLKIQ